VAETCAKVGYSIGKVDRGEGDEKKKKPRNILRRSQQFLQSQIKSWNKKAEKTTTS
jgi:hypothetical protein